MKVLVGCPTSEHKAYCLNEYVEGLKKLSYKNKDILIVDNSKDDAYSEKIKALGINVLRDKHLKKAKERIIHSRNILRKKVLDEGYDYFLSLEQDVIPPKDIIERLLKHKKKIITGVYYTIYKFNGVENVRPLLWGEVPGQEDKMRFLNEEVKKDQVIEIKACGLGVILMHRDVLEKISFGLDENLNSFDDMVFCQDAKKNGFKIYADTSIKCKHLIKGMDWEAIEKEENESYSN
jgi:hypothetical protein